MRPLVALTLATLALMPAWARAVDSSLTPSASVACLTPDASQRNKLEYPADSLQRKDGGTVSVELRFVAPDSPPRVKVLAGSKLEAELVEAVKQHVASFRLPCLPVRAPDVTLRQDYVFIPNDGRKVMTSGITDEADEARRAAMKCMRRAKGQEGELVYPVQARDAEHEGNVLLRMSAAGPDAEPQAEVLAASQPVLARAAVEYAAGYRLPCLTAPLEWKVLFHFKLEGGRRTVLIDQPLIKMLSASKSLPPAYFDFGRMGCPFDLRLTYYQPHYPNVVRQLESNNPAREPLLEWLAGISLRLDERQNTAVLGNQMTVSVPCGTLDF